MVDTVNGQITELSEDARRKQMLVDNMAHEMRTPLTSIRGYAEYIEKAAVPDEEKTDSAKRPFRRAAAAPPEVPDQARNRLRTVRPSPRRVRLFSGLSGGRTG